MIPELNGKGLFVFSDPGGAKPILALIAGLRTTLEEIKVISDRQYSFYADFRVEVEISELSADQQLIEFQPNFILTGTSYTSELDKNYIAAGKKAEILVYSFVDHWTNIRARFQSNYVEILPDLVLLVDNEAKKIALQEGIHEDKLLVVGNPYQSYLKSWTPAVSRDVFFDSLGIGKSNKKIIVFGPDPLSNVNGSERFGFDEIEGIRQLASIADYLVEEYIILLNPHPNQKIEDLLNFECENLIVLRTKLNVNTLIFYADIVVGFFSSFLLEAVVMGKTVIRFFPTPIKNDPFEHMEIGQIAVGKDALLKILIS